MRHRNALRWLLTELECPPIPNPLQWPWTGHSEGSTPNRPIQLADPRNAAPPEVEQIVSTLLATWRDERDCYPDWFIAPKRVRDAIWSATEPQLTFIDHIGKETLTEQIVDLYRETCWRLNVSLAPPTPFTQSCYKLLKNIGFFSDETDQSHGLFVIWNKVNERVDAAQHIALFVARAAIRDGNDQCFHQVTGAIRKHRYRTQDVNNELIYAQALWTRDHALFRDLEKCLEPWNVDLADHGWGIRKAGLLSYLGWTRSSQALGSATIRNIRQYRRRDIVDLAAFSREAWALWHLPRSDAPTTKCAGRARASSELQRVRNAESEDDETFDEWANDASARWRELAVYDCNPLAECAELLANLFAVRVSHAADPTANEPHDSGNSSVSRSLRHIRRVNEMLRLADEISLGCVNGQSRRFQLALRASIVESASSTPYMSSIYAIRLATEADDPMLKQVFSHTRVSKLDPANRELLETILKTERDFLKGHEASRFFNHLERNRRGAVVEHVLKALAAPAEVVSTAVEQPVPPPE